MVNVKKMNRVYLIANIILFFLSFSFVFFQLKVSYKVTNTGIYYKKLVSGKGGNVDEYVKNKKIEAEKSKDKSSDEEKKHQDEHYLMKIERTISYKNKVIEYTNQDIRKSFVYDYEYARANNFCGDYIECLNMLKNIGDKYRFLVKKKYMFFDSDFNINDEDYVCVEMKLVDVFSSKDYYKKYTDGIQQSFKFLNEKGNLCSNYIVRYLENIGRDYVSVNNFFLTVEDPGRGEKIVTGDKVKYNYYIKVHDGNIFDTNVELIAKVNNIYSNKKKYEVQEYVVKDSNYGPLACLKHLKKSSNGRIYYPIMNISYVGEISFYEMWIEIIDVEKGVAKVEKKSSYVNKSVEKPKITSNMNVNNVKKVDSSASANLKKVAKKANNVDVKKTLNIVNKSEGVSVNSVKNTKKDEKSKKVSKKGKKNKVTDLKPNKKTKNKKVKVKKVKDKNKEVKKVKESKKAKDKKNVKSNDVKAKKNKKVDNKKDKKAKEKKEVKKTKDGEKNSDKKKNKKNKRNKSEN